MNIPVSFKLQRQQLDDITNWVLANDMTSRITYDWVSNVLTFEDEDDVVAFTLAFGIERHKTRVDQLLDLERLPKLRNQ